MIKILHLDRIIVEEISFNNCIKSRDLGTLGRWESITLSYKRLIFRINNCLDF